MEGPNFRYYDISLDFLDSDLELYRSEKPFYSNVPFTKSPEARSSNVKAVSRHLRIADIRGSEHLFNLDLNGFQLIKNRTRFDKWRDGKCVVAEHYPEVEALLRSELHADEVIIYDHTVSDIYYRRSNVSAESRAPNRSYRRRSTKTQGIQTKPYCASKQNSPRRYEKCNCSA